MRKITLTLLMSVIALSTWAQGNSETLYFGYKKGQLTTEHKNQLSALLDSLKSDSIAVKIEAHCDSVGGVEYNEKLGNDRASAVKRFVMNKNVMEDNITVTNHGSTQPAASNETEEGREKNRRVIVNAWSLKAGKGGPVTSDSTAVDQEVAKRDCSLDTTIVLDNGTEITMNVCEYLAIKECLTITEYITPEALRGSDYYTVGFDGPLVSAGVVDVKFCGDTCLTNPIVIRVPVKECTKEKTFLAYTGYTDGVWKSSSPEVRKILSGGKEFYTYETKCPATINFATKYDVTPKFKFKAKGGVKINEIKVSYDCGMAVYGQTFETPVKKVKMLMTCPSNASYIYVKGVDKEGKEVVMEYKNSSEVKSKFKQKKCKETEIDCKFYVTPDDVH